MLVVTNIIQISYGKRIELPFVRNSCRFFMPGVGYQLVLVDTETNQTSIIHATNFGDLVYQLRDLTPYGYVEEETGHGNNCTVVAVSKFAFKFLDLVESVDIAERACKIDAVKLQDASGVCVMGLLDDSRSLYAVCINLDLEFLPRECYITLFDLVCLMQNKYKDGFYFPATIEVDRAGYQTTVVPCKVTCSNLQKAQSLVAKAKVLNPDLAKKLYQCGEG